MTELFGRTLPEVAALLAPHHVPNYRAKQIVSWMYEKDATSFSEMTNLPKALRDALAEAFTITHATCIRQWDSADGKTTKFLLAFSDGVAVETVLMRQPYGNSICVSTQAGCAMGCVFCASALHGVTRNLTVAELLTEFFFIEGYLRRTVGQHVDTMVLMGAGEPMMNYENVVAFLRLLHEPYCANFGYRNVTLSTSGVVPGILRLTEEGIHITLSISLHAPNNEIRNRLMPVNRKYPIEEVLDAAKHYADTTKRRVTYEYILIADVNDGAEAARSLANLLRGQLANVNLIPINPVTERNLLRPSAAHIDRFEKILQERHVNVTVRREMGTDIEAACGQLRNKQMAEEAAQ